MIPPIAVIGGAARFANASSLGVLLGNLEAGRSAIVSAPPKGRWPPGVQMPGAFLEDAYVFDPARFGIPDREAVAMDPQQRWMLTVTADALEGLDLGTREVGVFIAATQLAYQDAVTAAIEPTALEPVSKNMLAGNLLSMLAARVSHRFDLTGPSFSLAAACASSLVALHQACLALDARDCEVAIVGGVNLNLTPTVHRLFEKAGALSPTGALRAFDGGDGTVPGDGVGCLILERLERAERSGRRVWATILATAVNNCGRTIGVMAPRPEGQIDVMREALRRAGVASDEVAFIEAHGTGTDLGDQIEQKSIDAVYPHRPRVSAIKRVLGHTLGAAGVAGLSSALLQLGEGELGAVSAFGFGGSNAHVILRGGALPSSVLEGGPRPARGRVYRLGVDGASGWLHRVERGPEGESRFSPLASPRDTLVRRGLYVITGGSGGIGRVIARALARNLRARLLLVGRRPVDAELEALLEELATSRTRARYCQADLRVPEDAARVLEAARAMGAVDGLIHAAGVTGPDAMAVKRDGLLALDALAPARTLLLSSLSAVIDGLDRGLGAYVDANRWLNAHARAMRAQGRAVTSVALAPWAEVGMAASLAEHYRARGIEPIPTAVGEAALLDALSSDEPVIAVMRRGDAEPRRKPGVGSTQVVDDWRATLRSMIAHEAQVPIESLRDDAHLMTLGVDSLAAIDLVKALEEQLGRALPTTFLFEHDTIDKLVVELEAVSAAAATRPDEPPEPITVEPPAPELPLLDAQRTFFVQQRCFPTLPCNVFLAVSLRRAAGPALEPDRLRVALTTLVRRHPVLRSYAEQRGARFVQLADGPEPALEWVASVDDEAVANQVLDLSGPLLRVVCDGARLALHGHHLLIDAWSAKLLVEELLDLYERGTDDGGSARVPGWFEISPALRARQVSDADLAWWRGRLSGGVPPIRLPYDGDPDVPPRGPARSLRVTLSPEATGALEERARRAASTLPAWVLSAYARALYDISGQHDLTIRVAHGRRDARVAGINEMIGSFADSLPVRITLEPGEALSTVASRTQRSLQEAYAHASASSLALAGLVSREANGPQGLTPAGFSFLNLGSETQIGELELTDVHGASASGFTRLGLIAWVFAGRLTLSFNTLADHFEPQTVRAIAERVEAHLLDRPELGFGAATRLDAALVAACARYGARPLTEDLTFEQLDRASAALAAKLEGKRIAVLAEPGRQALVGVLGVMRSGAAYVPLDPAWPDARIEAILADAGPSALVHAEQLSERARRLTDGSRVAIAVDALLAEADAEADAEAGQLAWIMYTSGSTGRPKGVCVPHSSALTFLGWVERVLGLTEQDVFLQTSSLGFGGSIRQMFSPILAGARLVVADRATKRDPDALLRLLRDREVSIYNSVPSLFTHLTDAVAEAGPASVSALRWVLLGGEAVPTGVLRRWRRVVPAGPRIANLYGSTESVVNATWYEIPSEIPEQEVMTPIGWPRHGTPVSLRGERDGVGEIVVGGAIARGYLGDARGGFEGDASDPGSRVYRTGDLARRDARGNLVYLGREDSQVQVWGNRVELGEIEATLCALDGVRAAMVRFVDQRLSAYVETDVRASEVSVASLRASLASRLPAFMVPHAFIIGELPRTAAGKTDRRAGPSPVSDAGLASIIRASWRDVLRLDALPDDGADFFAAGGDSMLAIELASVIRARTERRISPLSLHRRPTLGALIALVEGRAKEANEPPNAGRAAIEDPTGPAPLGPVQRGFWSSSRDGAAPVMVTTLPLEGPVDRARLLEAFTWIQARHPILRARFVDAEQRLGAAPFADLGYEDLTLLDGPRAEERLEAIRRAAQERPFDLAEGPLLRAELCRLGPTTHALVLSAHHILLDGQSAWVLLHELLALHDRPGPLPPPVPERLYLRVARAPMPPADPFWDDTLARVPPHTAARPATGPVRARFRLDASELERLRSVARRRGATPFAIVFSAFAAALLEDEGDDELLVATAVTGRDAHPELTEAVGPFAHGVPVWVTRDADENVRRLRAAISHADTALSSVRARVPFDALGSLGRFFLSWLEPPPSLGASSALRPVWDEADLRFATESTATEVSAAALVHDGGLVVHLRGESRAARVAEAMPRHLAEHLARRSALVIYAPSDTRVPFAKPTLVETVTSAVGTTELILLPSNERQLRDAGRRAAELRAALALTSAEVIALAGMLPSLTGLGRGALQTEHATLTTGHAATVVAMLKTVERALLETGRGFAECRVGVLGFGAIGQATLALCAARLGPPRSVRVADPRFGASVSELSGCDLILGATSGGRALSVAELAPGTVVVDDSFPRAFDDAEAWARMSDAGDVLLVGGGSLDVGPLERRSPFPQAEAVRAGLPTRWLPGCHAEALLVAARPELGPTVGPVDLPRALAVLEAVDAMGWRAPPLHLGAHEVPA